MATRHPSLKLWPGEEYTAADAALDAEMLDAATAPWGGDGSLF